MSNYVYLCKVRKKRFVLLTLDNMDFKSTVDIIINDIKELEHIVDDFKNYPEVSSLQIKIAKSKCRNAIEILEIIKEEGQERVTISKEEVEKNVALLDTSVYMSQFIGQEFEGTVICVSNNGLTIQLDNLLEGRVRTRNLEGSYAYNSDTYTLLSLEGNDNYYVGDRLRLRLLNADKEQKSVDFEVIEKIKENRIKSDEESNNKVKSKARDDKFKKTFKS